MSYTKYDLFYFEIDNTELKNNSIKRLQHFMERYFILNVCTSYWKGLIQYKHDFMRRRFSVKRQLQTIFIRQSTRLYAKEVQNSRDYYHQLVLELNDLNCPHYSSGNSEGFKNMQWCRRKFWRNIELGVYEERDISPKKQMKFCDGVKKWGNAEIEKYVNQNILSTTTSWDEDRLKMLEEFLQILIAFDKLQIIVDSSIFYDLPNLDRLYRFPCCFQLKTLKIIKAGDSVNQVIDFQMCVNDINLDAFTKQYIELENDLYQTINEMRDHDSKINEFEEYDKMIKSFETIPVFEKV